MWLKSPTGENLVQAYVGGLPPLSPQYPLHVGTGPGADKCHVLFRLAHETWEPREGPIEEVLWCGALGGGQDQV